MSQDNINKIQQMPVAQLGRLPAAELFAWLKTKPTWLRESVLGSLARAH